MRKVTKMLMLLAGGVFLVVRKLLKILGADIFLGRHDADGSC